MQPIIRMFGHPLGNSFACNRLTPADLFWCEVRIGCTKSEHPKGTVTEVKYGSRMALRCLQPKAPRLRSFVRRLRVKGAFPFLCRPEPRRSLMHRLTSVFAAAFVLALATSVSARPSTASAPPVTELVTPLGVFLQCNGPSYCLANAWGGSGSYSFVWDPPAQPEWESGDGLATANYYFACYLSGGDKYISVTVTDSWGGKASAAIVTDCSGM
jgi:hypothetical protein